MAKTKNKTHDNKDLFIVKLMDMSREEINDFIKKNGKPMKLINPIRFLK